MRSGLLPLARLIEPQKPAGFAPMWIGSPRTPQEQAEALACLLRVGPTGDGAERVAEALGLAAAGEIDLDGLVAARRGREVVAAALFLITADRSAFVWPPEVRDRGGPDDAVSLLREIGAQADAAACPYSQAAIEPERQDHETALRAAGFEFLTNLLVMQRPLDRPLPEPSSIEGRVVEYTEERTARFAAAIERSYDGSLDCLGFSGVRTAASALDSYRAAGVATPGWWRIIERDSGDVAVILVNGRPDERAREIVYLGVACEARRQGLARQLILIALHEARQADLSAVTASVDETNQPAVKLYETLGFFPSARRSVFLRKASSSTSSIDRSVDRDVH